VAVTDRGIAITTERLWDARPKEIVSYVPFDLPVTTQTTKTHCRVRFDQHQIWLRRNEFEIISAAVVQALTPGAINHV
jgi:hypothetical protein